MLAQKKDEFARLFQEFLNSYPYTPAGLHHTAAYEKQRQQGKRNFEAIATAADFGEDVIELIVLQLLPYPDATKNRQRGAWIHMSSFVTKDIKECFEASMWIKPEDWQYIALAILNFVRSCNDDPKQLSAACVNFSQLPYVQYLPTGTITPILNALQPEDFLLINNQFIRVINYFKNTVYTDKITDSPKLNVTGKKLIAELSQQMHQSGVPALRDDDLFDMFSHWLVAIKKYNLTGKDNPRFQEVELQPEYTLAECAEKIGFNEAELERWIRGIHRKGQAILYGSPGTGKTFIAEKLAQHLIGGGNGFSELVQFHPAYSYEDFIQGIRPQNEDGKLTYPLVPGRFVQFCKEVENCQGICVLIIDEINRANLAQVFGELMYLLEYRDKEIPLAGGNRFRIPANVRIIGTMNTADRSIALVDYALRRRFAFIELRPNYDFLRRYHLKTGFPVEELIKILEHINLAISDKNYEIGISFFLIEKLSEDIEDIWRMEIEPYLEEYFFNQLEKVNEFRWEKVKQQLSL